MNIIFCDTGRMQKSLRWCSMGTGYSAESVPFSASLKCWYGSCPAALWTGCRQGPLCYWYSWKDGSRGQFYKLYVAQCSSSAPQLTSSTLNDACAFCSPFPSLPLFDAFTSKILWAILNWRELEYNCLYRNKKGSPFSRSSHSRLEDHSCNTLSYHENE